MGSKNIFVVNLIINVCATLWYFFLTHDSIIHLNMHGLGKKRKKYIYVQIIANRLHSILTYNVR